MLDYICKTDAFFHIISVLENIEDGVGWFGLQQTMNFGVGVFLVVFHFGTQKNNPFVVNGSVLRTKFGIFA